MKEKARVTLKAGKEIIQLKVSVSDIENKKIASVQKRIEREMANEKKRIMSYEAPL